jgi:hypothetical protein
MREVDYFDCSRKHPACLVDDEARDDAPFVTSPA